MNRTLVIAAMVIPILGLLAMIGRAQFAVSSGLSWQIPINGFDPRDPLHGRYLRYTYDFNFSQPKTCGSNNFDPSCCLCLTKQPTSNDPSVQTTTCEQARRCDGWLKPSTVQGPQRYFVPENRALELERLIRAQNTSIELTSTSQGTPAVTGLLINGQLWRDQVREAGD